MLTLTERIKQFNNGRVPLYTALKYQVMAENVFRFFRGTCHLFYEDLFHNNTLPPSPATWISGDLHLENFGSYKGDNRMVYFDLNDFDEALLAPAAWELVRMVTSIFTAFDVLHISQDEARQAGLLFLKTYAATLSKEKARYIELATANGIVKTFLLQVGERKQKELISRRTVLENNNLVLRVDNSHLFKIEDSLKKDLSDHLSQWIEQQKDFRYHYSVKDACFRIAGTGSIGEKRYLFLLCNTENPKKHMLLDMKQANTSSVKPYVSIQQPGWSSEAERVIAIQQRMQNISPALLNTIIFKDDSYVLKEMQPIADKIDFLLIRDRYKDISCVIDDMALLTASAQLRSTCRQGSAIADDLVAFGQDGQWHQAILDYAGRYATQAKEDFQLYAGEYKAGNFK